MNKAPITSKKKCLFLNIFWSFFVKFWKFNFLAIIIYGYYKRLFVKYSIIWIGLISLNNASDKSWNLNVFNNLLSI